MSTPYLPEYTMTQRGDFGVHGIILRWNSRRRIIYTSIAVVFAPVRLGVAACWAVVGFSDGRTKAARDVSAQAVPAVLSLSPCASQSRARRLHVSIWGSVTSVYRRIGVLWALCKNMARVYPFLLGRPALIFHCVWLINN